MTVCKCTQCGFCWEGMCRRRVTALDESGMCELWWKNGQQKIGQKDFAYKAEMHLENCNKQEREVNPSPEDDTESSPSV